MQQFKYFSLVMMVCLLAILYKYFVDNSHKNQTMKSSSSNHCTTTPTSNRKDFSLSKYLKSLGPWKLPERYFKFQDEIKKRREKMHLAQLELLREFWSRISTTQSRFMALHLFEGGVFELKPNNSQHFIQPNSFERFTTEPSFLKRYIVNLHRMAPGADVLFTFKTKDQLQDGIRRMKGKWLAIIDANIHALRTDIGHEVHCEFNLIKLKSCTILLQVFAFEF